MITKDYSFLLQSLTQGVVLVDGYGKVIEANPAAELIFGVELKKKSNAFNNAVLDVIREDGARFSDDSHPAMVALQTGKPLKNAVVGIFNPYDNAHRWVIMHAFPIIENCTELSRVYLLCDDFTDRIDLESELIDCKADAEMAKKEKTDFLANMSHELRTPLNSIIGFSQILETKLQDKIDSKLLNYMVTIQKSSNYLLNLLDDILDLARIDAGKTQLDKAHFDLGKLLSRIPETLKTNTFHKKLRLEIDVPSDLGAIIGDEVKLKQVFYNLLSNAVSYTESGNRIGIKAKSVDNRFQITIWDEGIGIPKDSIPYIFEAFSRNKLSRHPKEVGTGLGLSISKIIIEKHGGEISVSSQEGKGSRFMIKLPGRLPSHTKKTSSKISEKAKKSKQNKELAVLLVEDNKSNAKLMIAALKMLDYQIDHVDTGEKAITSVLVKPYDVILMDVHLPGITGIDAMKQINLLTQKSTSIIALTADAMREDQMKYLKLGFDGYIPKPVQISNLNELVHKLI